MFLRNGVAAPGQDQRQHVAGIVAGIGEERHGMRQHAVGRLNCDQSYIENRGNGERGSERGRHMTMAMVVTVVMSLMMVMMMTVAMLVRLMRRHAFRLSIARAHARAFSRRRATRATHGRGRIM